MSLTFHGQGRGDETHMRVISIDRRLPNLENSARTRHVETWEPEEPEWAPSRTARSRTSRSSLSFFSLHRISAPEVIFRTVKILRKSRPPNDA